MYKITQYENIKNYKINSTYQIDEVLSIIKNGDDNLPLIQLAREYGKGSPQYNLIKENNLPTYRYNFLFRESASNKNISVPTGLIYIDVDSDSVVPENEYVYASWKSLSNTGYGLLAKVDNLTQTNFKYVYEEISELIGIDSDKQASKPTQQTVLSYDSDLYFNTDSTTYHYINKEKVSSPNNFKKGKGSISTYDTFQENSSGYTKIRYNNIDDYFIGSDEVYIVFKDKKVMICNPFVPRKIEKGKRNHYLFIFLSQIVALNLTVPRNYLKLLVECINVNAMKPKLSDGEMNKVMNSVYNKRDNGTLEIYFNQERRILFNPVIKMTQKDKMVIVNRELGQMKSEATKAIIYEVIEDWDFIQSGKITQNKVAELSTYSIATIKRYWHHFKAYIKGLNDDYRRLKLYII